MNAEITKTVKARKEGATLTLNPTIVHTVKTRMAHIRF